MREYHILNLGAGVQSTALYLMDLDLELEHQFDCAIFADTGDEPAAVYKHLEWLQSLGGAEILVRSRGCLGDDLLKGQNSTGQRFVSIPAFTQMNTGGSVGQVRRQCTMEYKVQVVEKCIRRDVLGLLPRQRTPKDVKLVQYLGFSLDEPGRAARARGRFELRGWSDVRFPLIEDKMTRQDCMNYLEKRVPHHVPRSACVYCPYKSNREWLRLKNNDPEGWARAVEIDEGMRTEGTVLNRKTDANLYLHRSCKPLAEAPLDENQLELFDMENEGGCGL